MHDSFRDWFVSETKKCFIWHGATKNVAAPECNAGSQDAPPRGLRPVCIHRVDNQSFSAEGGWIYRDGQKFVNGNIMPSWSDMTTEDSAIRQKLSTDFGDEIEAAFILTHNPTDPYGHFLLEMAPKLMAILLFSDAGFDIPILLSWYTPPYVEDWIKFIAPGASLVRIPQSKRIRVRKCYYCDMFLDNYWPVPAFETFIACCVKKSKSRKAYVSAEKLFISRRSRRRQKADFRYWDNEEAVEQVLLAEGFVSIQPEAAGIAEQIQAFHAAKIIVGELSSALHNAIFAAAGARIVQINPFNDVQRRLSLSLGQRITSILPDSGQVCGWPPAEERPRNFTVETSKILAAILSSRTQNVANSFAQCIEG